jgi:hypothetical protein
LLVVVVEQELPLARTVTLVLSETWELLVQVEDSPVVVLLLLLLKLEELFLDLIGVQVEEVS